MNVIRVIGGNTGVDAFQMNPNQGSDPVGRNIQDQIANAQKRMQELSENKELSLEEKMKKRQELRQQISDLQNQLRQHQIEQRKEEQQKKKSDLDDWTGSAAKYEKSEDGLLGARMQAMISADSSMRQVRVQGAVKTETEGKAGILESEIKRDGALGVDTEQKKEELAGLLVKAAGNDSVKVYLKDKKLAITLEDDIKVRADSSLTEKLAERIGKENVKVTFRTSGVFAGRRRRY